MIPLMATLLRIDPSLALADALPISEPAADPVVAPPQAPPLGLGGGAHDTARLQTQLNRLGADPPLTVDGSYGRATRRAVAAFQAAHGLAADGIAGPITIAEIKGLS